MQSTEAVPGGIPGAEKVREWTGRSTLLAPLIPISALLALSFLPRIQRSIDLVHVFWAVVGGLLLIFGAILLVPSRREGLRIRFIARAPHYVQAIVQTGVYAYWGWYWRPVYDQAALILAQIIFVYALDLLVSLAKRRQWVLGFGPFPIIFSTNLFLWFKDDWFFLQFAMIALGVLGKEFITWKRNGRRVHIFNPSAFALSVASVLLLATHNTALSWGYEIANTLSYPQHIYLWIFLLGLVVQYLFDVTMVTLAAAATLFAIGMSFYALTGVYFFITSDIPIAVFLGLHLLVTDPVTSPRSNIGRALFGALYGTSVIVLFALLDSHSSPTFYDKLLAVPLLNLSVPALDRFAAWIRQKARPLHRPITLTPPQLNKAFMGVWIVFFISLLGAGRFGSAHPGRHPAFWEHACEKNLDNACRNLHDLLADACAQGHGYACAKLGWVYARGLGVARDENRAFALVTKACRLGFEQACERREEFRPHSAAPAASEPYIPLFPWETSAGP